MAFATAGLAIRPTLKPAVNGCRMRTDVARRTHRQRRAHTNRCVPTQPLGVIDASRRAATMRALFPIRGMTTLDSHPGQRANAAHRAATTAWVIFHPVT